MKVIVDIPEDVIEATKNGSANIYDLCGYLMNGETLEPCEELDFVQPHKKVPVNLEVCKMREATQKEREGIGSIAEPCEDAKAHSKKEEGRPVVLPYRERKCRRCKYGDAYELQKPCIVYSESCELFAEKE